MHPFVGSEEFINGGERWILYLGEAPPGELRAMPEVLKRIAAVKEFRMESKSAGTQALGDIPTSFHVTVVPDRPFLVILKVSSERRDYVRIGRLEAQTGPRDHVSSRDDP